MGKNIRKEIAIQGATGSFHHIAAQLICSDKDIGILPESDFESLVKRVGTNHTIGLMAIENSLVGGLIDNYRLLHAYSVKVTGEIYLRIKQNLMANPGATIETLTEVHSHPMALAQCAHFFHDHPHIRLIETDDTAESAEMVSKSGKKTIGAVASSLAAELYGLDILGESIESNHMNYTRFLRIEPTGEMGAAEKASVVLTLPHEKGSLHKLLGEAEAAGLNLTKIQSMPIAGEPWKYRFFIDVVSDRELTTDFIFDRLKTKTTGMDVIGIYKPGKHFEA